MQADPKKILFLDIETVPCMETFTELTVDLQHCWEDKFAILSKRMPEKYENQTTPAQAFEQSAGIYSEFGKIICISVGFIHNQENNLALRVTSFTGENEKKLLMDFKKLIEESFSTYSLCGHNIKEFDIPYICRRMLINKISLPETLNISGKKPWEVPFIDTLELWKFGDAKNYISLKLLSSVLGINTPKDDIDGSQVGYVYYKEHNLKRIALYCQKDVAATVQVFLRINGLDTIEEQNIEFV